MYCSKCGANVPDGAAFCNACGQSTAGVAAGRPGAGTPAPPVAGAPVYAPPVQAGWQAPVARPAVAYAGFWLRFVAFIIDAIVLGFVGWFIFL
ncbi:MAG: zinc-ribbon domain-containing protein, partial [Candidatus Acidiferrales bacterium]